MASTSKEEAAKALFDHIFEREGLGLRGKDGEGMWDDGGILFDGIEWYDGAWHVMESLAWSRRYFYRSGAIISLMATGSGRVTRALYDVAHDACLAVIESVARRPDQSVRAVARGLLEEAQLLPLENPAVFLPALPSVRSPMLYRPLLAFYAEHG